MSEVPAGEQLAQAAASLIGTPFRLHGRDPSTGLDCVGLVHASLLLIGRSSFAPEGYRLRNCGPTRWLRHAELSGLQSAQGALVAGDVVLIAADFGQHHLLIADDTGVVIHAHAGLRKVVRQPMAIRSVMLRHWRLV